MMTKSTFKNFLLVLLSVSFVACNSNKSSWKKQKISFPQNSVFTKAGKDTVHFDFNKSKWKFFI